MILDGAPFAAPTHCRCGAPAADSRYIGAQVTATPGDLLLLANCATCRTTIAVDGVNDASICARCGVLILGDNEDPKVATDAGVICADCAPCAADVRDRFPGLASAQVMLDCRYQMTRPRRAPVMLGEVRAGEG